MRARLVAYVEGFKVGDFDAIRAMLADDVKLDLVAKFQKQGKGEVSEYYGAYAASEQWAFAAGVVGGRAAMLVYDREVSLDAPAYFVALGFNGDQVSSIQDFLYARYAHRCRRDRPTLSRESHFMQLSALSATTRMQRPLTGQETSLARVVHAFVR